MCRLTYLCGDYWGGVWVRRLRLIRDCLRVRVFGLGILKRLRRTFLRVCRHLSPCYYLWMALCVTGLHALVYCVSARRHLTEAREMDCPGRAFGLHLSSLIYFEACRLGFWQRLCWSDLYSFSFWILMSCAFFSAATTNWICCNFSSALNNGISIKAS